MSEYNYTYEPKIKQKTKKNEEVELIEEKPKTDFIVLIHYSTLSDKLFANIIEGYQIPYSYEFLEDLDDKISEYTFPIDCFDVIKVIIDMRSINVIKIV